MPREHVAVQGGLDLLSAPPLGAPDRALAEGAWHLRGFALAQADALLAGIADVIARAPLRHMKTPGGKSMSVAMTCTGPLGWVSDESGYRYAAIDPLSGEPWPKMPDAFVGVATASAARAGFPGFVPDACLVNRYAPGARLSLHRDADERDYAAPIVSVSLGVSALFLFGGLTRKDPTERIRLFHGDVLVWGGPSRLRYHGVMPMESDQSSVLGPDRVNLTFRLAR